MKTKTNLLKPLLLAIIFLVVWSCGPVARILEVESIIPAKYPVDLESKSVSIFFPVEYLDSIGEYLSVNDSIFMKGVSAGIAKEIESQLFLDEGAVYVYSHYPIDRNYDISYIQELSFVSNSDIVILLDSMIVTAPQIVQDSKVEYGEAHSVNYVYSVVKTLMIVYDGTTGEKMTSIFKNDSVYWEVLSRNELRQEALVGKVLTSIPSVSEMLGRDIAENLFPGWIQQQRNLYVFPNNRWEDAYSYATQFRWKEAMEIWLDETTSKDKVRAAAAAFNMAVACELTDRTDLALEWAEISYRSFMLKGIISYKLYLKEKIEEEQSK